MSPASLLLAPGLLQNGPVQTAMAVGGCAAIVSAVVGVFTVMRGQSFAGHALADVGSAGGAAAFLLGVNPLLGFAVMGVLGAAGMELLRVERARERDLVTGVVLGAGLGLAALLLYLDVTSHSTTGAAITVMFGSVFAIEPEIVRPALLVGLLALGITATLWRPLLLSAVDPALAAARGVPVRAVGLLHLLSLALAVSLSAITVGAILSTALLVAPAAIGLRLGRRPGAAVLVAVAVALLATAAGIVMAYDSLQWSGRSWPVSFCIVSVLFCLYLGCAHLPRPRRGRAG